MSTSETITRTDLTNILNEVLPTPPLNELIYSGSFTTGTTTLQKSVANYVKILIVYEDNDSTVHTKVVITNKASAFTTACTVLRVTGLDYKKCMIVSFNGTSMNVQYNKQGSGTATPTDGSYITIKKVYGVKAIDSDAIAEQADYIVEQGTSGIWTYRKWNSGIAECWGTYTSPSTVSASGPIGSWYYASVASIAFPFTFTQVPTVEASGKWDSGYSFFNAREIYANEINSLQMIKNESGAATVTARFYVVGKWK